MWAAGGGFEPKVACLQTWKNGSVVSSPVFPCLSWALSINRAMTNSPDSITRTQL